MRHKSQDGFTLLEMLVILVIVSFVAVISLPYAQKSGEARRLDAAAEIVTAKLREARSLALSSNQKSSLTIDVEKRQLMGPGFRPPYALPAGLLIKVTTAEGQTSENIGSISFFPDGGSTGGSIVMADGAMARRIAINWLTGAVVWQAVEPHGP